MCPCSLFGVHTSLADCYSRAQVGTDPGCLFRHLPFVSLWDLATTLPALYPLPWVRALHAQAEFPADLHLPVIQLSLSSSTLGTPTSRMG